MPDFSELLRQPAGEAKRPKALKPGDYPGVVRSHEVGDNNKNKTVYVRFGLTITDWPEDFTQEEIAEWAEEVPDLSKRQLRKDFFFTQDALWRLDDFIRSCGIEPQGRRYEDILPEMVGQPVKMDVRHYRNQNDEVSNTVESVVGVNGSK